MFIMYTDSKAVFVSKLLKNLLYGGHYCPLEGAAHTH